MHELISSARTAQERLIEILCCEGVNPEQRLLWIVLERAAMRYLIASGSRSGSMFSIKMLEKFVGASAYPMAKVHSSRDSVDDLSPSYRESRAAGDLAGFITQHGLNALKLEDPGLDDDADILFEAFPEAIVIATYRPVEKVVNSHGNIKPWGFPPKKTVRIWIANLAFYEKAQRAGRLVLIPLDNKTKFNAEAAARTLGAAVTEDVITFIDDWPSVNDLVSQKKVSRDDSPTGFFMSRDELVAQFPEIPAAEARYDALTRATNSKAGA